MLAFEVSRAAADDASSFGGKVPRLSRLRVRALLGDPIALRDRPVYAGVNVLTIVADGDDTRFVMHHRASDRVASAMGTNHVVPAGEFQPSGVDPAAWADDLELWRCISREYAEELLGEASAAGQGHDSVRFELESPHLELAEGLQAGTIRAWFLGMGLDPLSLKAEILCAVVFDRDTFRSIFGETLRSENEEGILLRGSDLRGPRFPDDVSRYLSGPEQEKTLSAAAACLALGVRHADVLLR